MTGLSGDFEDVVRDAALDEALRRARETWVPAMVEQSHQRLRQYGGRNDYDVEPIIESLELPRVTREDDRIVARWGWDHQAAPFFDAGVSPHTIEGDPILSFVWEDAPPGVREMFQNTERVDGDPRVFFRSVDHPGIPASHFIRRGVDWVHENLDT
jgi:hypothetical protein